MENEPFVLVGVNSDSPLARAQQAVERNRLNWRSFQDRPAGASGSISDAWRVEAWPTLFVLDAERKLRYRGHDASEATRIARELVAGMSK